MDPENSLKKVRAQVKFGRVSGIRESLNSLLNQFNGTIHEASVLEVFALVFFKATHNHKEAIPLLNRLLLLDIPNETRKEAENYLLECKKKEEIVASSPDKNNAEFVEFVNIIRSKKIFNSNLHQIDFEDYIFIKETDEAKKLAWHQNIEEPYQSWNNLRTQASKQVHSYYFDNKIDMDFIDNIISKEIIEIFEQTTPDYLMDFYDDIYGDLIEIARGKLVGVITDLHGKMWAAYRNSLFPCGWKGAYPAGKLCVLPNRCS